MITVERFLCFTLETGGLFLGWLSLIGNILLAIASFIGIIVFSIYNCEDFAKAFDQSFTNDENETCGVIRGVFIGACVFLFALSIGFAYIGWLCIQGTRNRDHFRVKPLMILMAIATVLSIFQVASLTSSGICRGIINTAINAYCFVVLYSLYSKLRLEFESGGNRQYQLQQAGKV